jgi:hypothetical protein
LFPGGCPVCDSSKTEDCEGGIAEGDWYVKKRGGDGLLFFGFSDFGHLEYLPSGDAALTRRATKYSTLSAIVRS